jgi:hypothetical protein
MRLGRVRRSPPARWIGARSASGHRDAGSAMILAVVVIAAAAGVGAVAVAAVARAITAEDRTRRQEVVDLLAVSGAEEAFGRIVGEGFGLFEITGSTDPEISAHPAFGEDEDRSLGPWARFDEVGRVVPCGEDATAACYTLRLLTDADIPELTDPFGPAPRTVIIDVTARQCRAPEPASARCARARVQTTVVAREFLTEFATTTSSAVPDGDEMRSLAGLVLGPDSETTPSVSVSVSGSTLSAEGAAGVTEAAVPVNRVVFVDGDLEITSGNTSADPTLDLTVVASGSITISGDVLSGGLFAIVATGGEILITADVRTVEALLIANTPEVGAVRAVRADLNGDASLEITGAVVTREFDIPESDPPPELVFDSRLERLQPPFALEQVRGVWLRVDQVAVTPGS